MVAELSKTVCALKEITTTEIAGKKVFNFFDDDIYATFETGFACLKSDIINKLKFLFIRGAGAEAVATKNISRRSLACWSRQDASRVAKFC